MGGTRLNKPAPGMVPWRHGYLMVGEDGGIFSFGDGALHGSLGAHPASPVVSVALVLITASELGDANVRFRVSRFVIPSLGGEGDLRSTG